MRGWYHEFPHLLLGEQVVGLADPDLVLAWGATRRGGRTGGQRSELEHAALAFRVRVRRAALRDQDDANLGHAIAAKMKVEATCGTIAFPYPRSRITRPSAELFGAKR